MRLERKKAKKSLVRCVIYLFPSPGPGCPLRSVQGPGLRHTVRRRPILVARQTVRPHGAAWGLVLPRLHVDGIPASVTGARRSYKLA